MFTIHSTHAITFTAARFKLKKGENKFESKDKVPSKLWDKLERFKARGILKFGDDAPDAGGGDVPLTEEALNKLGLKQLQALAARHEVDVAGLKSKKDVIAKLLGAGTDVEEDDDSDDDESDDAPDTGGGDAG